MANRKPVGSAGYSSIRHLEAINNIDPPPAPNINAITRFPETGTHQITKGADFDFGEMKPS